MRRLILAAGFALLALVPTGSGGPVEGIVYVKEFRVPEADANGPGENTLAKRFVGGKRACVIVVGDHKPVVEIEVAIYDSKKRLVTQDKGSGEKADFVAVVWYPPRDEDYLIVVRNTGKEFNACSMAIK